MDGNFCSDDENVSIGKVTALVVIVGGAVSLLESSKDSKLNGKV